MECSEKPIFHNYTRQELAQIRITAPEEAVRSLVKKHWDTLAKPLDGMGSFETITAQIGAILGTEQIDLRKKGVLIFCADNGIVEEGVSQTGQEVTLAVAKSMARKGSSVCKMAQSIGAETIPVDIGINSEESIPGVLDRKVRPGTRNFLKEPTMTEEETVRAIVTGIELVQDCKEKGYGLLATGEMGIGNTTTSSAVTAALLQCEAEEVTGRGAGLTDQGLTRKQQVVRTALETYDLWHADAFTVLQTVGGLDIAGLTGMCIGGALWHIPIVLDGVISMAAALVAERLFPGVREWFGRINAFAESLGVQVEHYVISSGLREIIEGSGIAHEFREIYACEFFYDEEGLACWPKLDVNFTNKTQFVYRINKGVLDVADDKTLNDSMPDDSKRVPFTNMIYVGDGLSDVPCMKMMRSYGGQAIAVYQSSNRAGVEDLLAKGRVDFIFPADYREGTGLDVTVQNIIRKMAISDALTAENVRQIQSIGHTEVPGQAGLFE